jgi:hypothetical protein
MEGIMKYVTLDVAERIDGKDVKIGTVEDVAHAETRDDIIALIDDEENCGLAYVCGCFNYGNDVRSRAALKNAKRAKKTPSDKIIENGAKLGVVITQADIDELIARKHAERLSRNTPIE